MFERRKPAPPKRIDSLIGAGTTVRGDVLFSGGREGFFFALDAKSGALLWKAPVAGIVQAAPMSYAVRGRQYVAIAAGNSLYSYALRP